MERSTKEVQKDKWEPFSHEIESLQLQVGDHIYVSRLAGIYYHHGIYVGETNGVKYVIHFLSDWGTTDTEHAKPPCRKCGYIENEHAGNEHAGKVVRTCLKCFIAENIPFGTYEVSCKSPKVRKVDYDVGSPSYGTPLKPKPSSEVVKTAHELLADGFGKYNLVLNNFENFATYCKTGNSHSEQVVDYFAAAVLIGGVAVAAVSFGSYIYNKFKDKKKKKKEKSDSDEETSQGT